MPDRRPIVLAVLTSVTLLLVVCAGSVVGASSTASDLTPQVQRALVGAGLEDVDVVLRGREATVRGGMLAELTQAVRVAEQVRGVRSAAIDDAPGSVDDIDTTRPYLRLRRHRDRLRIIGAVPSAAAAATVKSSAARAFGVPVRGDLVIDPALPPVFWTDELSDAFGQLVGITRLELTVDGDTLELQGSLVTAAERAAVVRLVGQTVTSLTVESDVQIESEVP